MTQDIITGGLSALKWRLKFRWFAREAEAIASEDEDKEEDEQEDREEDEQEEG